MRYKKMMTLVGSFILLMTVLGSVIVFQSKSGSRPPSDRPAAKKRYRPLTTNTFYRHPKIRDSAIIYFAIKHVHIQRWQEIADFKAGWQVEKYRKAGHWRYLVWPDQHITEQEKQLTPNWFEFRHANYVIYHSFEVHTAQADEDQHVKVSMSNILKHINADRAAGTVRRMTRKLVIRDHD
ncbi:membrane protein [Lentilactobacillus fungorum]|uniref:Membrane protein n=1 Tax=Lentilactobacillus fungorum TaxID=2201250 RepID=A0ABQ3W3H1_9LACO|nr:hypothetical protein [Lentilactobacillus fungorum]GHP14154.1 membrane protein [Lentilactobacillus fungorum]